MMTLPMQYVFQNTRLDKKQNVSLTVGQRNPTERSILILLAKAKRWPGKVYPQFSI